jgi:threonylcarbamoyladenosine tRNA methylthiotransferase MtaB
LKFTVSTLGCKVNQHESDILAAGLNAHGWQAADKGETADVCIVNTCTVTQKASMQSRQLIRQLQRQHPGARIIVTGCYAQIAPKEIAAIDGVHMIAGQSRKADLPALIVQTAGKAESGPLCTVGRLPSTLPFSAPATPAPGARTRPYLKIQDGCDSFCTYCIVPHARGRSRSMPPDVVLRHLRQLGSMGYHEAVLTGIHLGAYGLDRVPAGSLLELLETIAQERPLTRIRLSSIEPHELSDELIDVVAGSDLFCPHFHLPLQSGDDTILQRMHRPYSRAMFRQRVMHIKRRLPRAAVGADVLVGFPGEDEAAFEQTCQLIAMLPLTYLHVFPFSARPGTPAATYPEQVPPNVVKHRTARVRDIGADKKQAFLQSTLGRKTEVLVETRRDAATGHLKGLTPNYLTVLLEGGDQCMNTIVRVEINRIRQDNRLEGMIVD